MTLFCVLRLGAAETLTALAPVSVWHIRLALLLPGWVPVALRFLNPEVRGWGAAGGGATVLFGLSEWCPLPLSWLPPPPQQPWLSPPPPTAQALLLAASPLLLPLPLKHHLWVQAAAVYSALRRMHPLGHAHVHAAGPGAECSIFVSGARLALQAVSSGTPLGLPVPNAEHRCCWMAHMWVLVMVGFFQPTAVAAALGQHAQDFHQGGEQEPQGDPREHRHRHSSRRPCSCNTICGCSSLAGNSSSPGTSWDTSSSSLTSSTISKSSGSSRDDSLRSGSLWRWQSDGSRHSTLLQELFAPRALQLRADMLAGMALAARLGRWHALLLPVGALVWAALELAILAL